MMETCQRTDPPLTGDEREMLIGYLDWQRDTLLCKLDGLSDQQLGQRHEPSTMTLLGMVKHLTWVELGWMHGQFLGETRPPDDDTPPEEDDVADPDWDWRIEPGDTTEGVVDRYRRIGADTDAIIRAHDLATPARAPRSGGREVWLRFIVLHLIEEIARHVGHADLIREAIDGQTGE